MDLGFALNYQFVYLIDTNPTGTPDWAFLGPGVESFTNDRADTTVDKAYWDKGGATSTNVTAVTSGWTVAGDRLVSDKAQDYVVGLAYLKGSERKTKLRQVGPDGEALEWPVTITDIKGAGADGNTPDNVPFGCALKCEGDPLLVVEAAGTELPETVTVAAVTVAVGGTAKIEPTVTPEDASGFCLFAVAESGRKVCRVDAEVNVHGLAAGETEVVVKCSAKPTVSAAVKVTVTES